MTSFSAAPKFKDWQKHHVIPQAVFGDGQFEELFSRLGQRRSPFRRATQEAA